MSNEDVKNKIVKWRAQNPGLPREKVGSRDSIRRKASRYEDISVEALAKLAKGGQKVPKMVQKGAATELLYLVGGRPGKPEDEHRPETEFDKMSQAGLLAFICETIMGMSQEAKGFIAEALLSDQKGLSFDPRSIDPNFDDEAARRAEAGLPPPKVRKEPRR